MLFIVFAVIDLTAADPKPADKPLTIGICASPKRFEPLGKHLEAHYRVAVVRIDATESGEVPDAATVAGCDVVLPNHYRAKPSSEQLKAIQDHYRAGKPVVGTRKAGHAYSDWPGINEEVFGAKCGSHFFDKKAEQTVFFGPAGKDHPLVREVNPVMCGGHAGQSMPVTWTRVNKERSNQRVF